MNYAGTHGKEVTGDPSYEPDEYVQHSIKADYANMNASHVRELVDEQVKRQREQQKEARERAVAHEELMGGPGGQGPLTITQQERVSNYPELAPASQEQFLGDIRKARRNLRLGSKRHRAFYSGILKHRPMHKCISRTTCAQVSVEH
jgi:hypothetical protein